MLQKIHLNTLLDTMNDNDVIRPLCIKLPHMTGYVRKFEGSTIMSFKISDKQKSTSNYEKEFKNY